MDKKFHSQVYLPGVPRFDRAKCLKRTRLFLIKPLILLIVVWNLMFIPVQQSF